MRHHRQHKRHLQRIYTPAPQTLLRRHVIFGSFKVPVESRFLDQVTRQDVTFFAAFAEERALLGSVRVGVQGCGGGLGEEARLRLGVGEALSLFAQGFFLRGENTPLERIFQQGERRLVMRIEGLENFLQIRGQLRCQVVRNHRLG